MQKCDLIAVPGTKTGAGVKLHFAPFSLVLMLRDWRQSDKLSRHGCRDMRRQDVALHARQLRDSQRLPLARTTLAQDL